VSSDSYRKIEQLWWSDKKPPLLLRASSHLYQFINHCNLGMRNQRAETPPLPLISVGNLTAGGSGKTPFVIWLAKLLQKEGFSPVVLCRGDGGKKGAPQLLSSESDPLAAGDEAVLLHERCGCPVIAGRDRVRGSRMAAEYGDIAILDDGFQYRQLERACDIVLVPATGIGNGHLIPAGPLREPIEVLERADLIVRSGQAETVRPLVSGKEWRWWTREEQLKQLAGSTAGTRPAAAVALTAIARPERFIDSLGQLGIRIEAEYLFPDHHPFTETDIRQAVRHNLPVIVTAKDAVKLKRIWPEGFELWELEQQAEAETGLFEAILARVNQSITTGEPHGHS